jgi:hypothetical protein
VILGLPATAWLLLVLAVAPGLLLVSAFYLKRRNRSGD